MRLVYHCPSLCRHDGKETDKQINYDGHNYTVEGFISNIGYNSIYKLYNDKGKWKPSYGDKTVANNYRELKHIWDCYGSTGERYVLKQIFHMFDNTDFPTELDRKTVLTLFATHADLSYAISIGDYKYVSELCTYIQPTNIDLVHAIDKKHHEIVVELLKYITVHDPK